MKNFLMQISSFGQVPFTFSKSKSQETFQEDQISEDSQCNKTKRRLKTEDKRRQDSFSTNSKNSSKTSSKEIPEQVLKWQIVTRFQTNLLSAKHPDKFLLTRFQTSLLSAKNPASDFLKISLFKLPRLLFKCFSKIIVLLFILLFKFYLSYPSGL